MKNSFKKLIFVLAVAAMVATLAFALVACGDKDSQDPTTPPPSGNTPSTGGNTPSTGSNTPSTGGGTTAIGTEFTVTLDTDGCKPLENTEFTVQYGKPCQLPVPKPENEIYTEFLGWAYNGMRLSFTDGSIANWNIEQNATLKAEFGNCVLLVKNGVIVGHSDRIALVSDLVIPSEIDGQTVTSIGDYAFEKCTTLTSLSIPDSVTRIGDMSFNGCTGLQTVTIGKNVHSIGDMSFDGCSCITKVNYLGDLKCWCEIEVSYAGPWYVATEYNASTAKLYVNDKEVTGDVNIPAGTSKIGEYAFRRLTDITSVTIPDSVTSIGDMAFSGCTGLQTVTIGNGVQSIGNMSFDGCAGITRVNIKSLKSWCNIQFVNDTANPLCVAASNSETSCKMYLNDNELTEVKDLDGVESISAYAFRNLTSITSVTIPDSVESVGAEAFSHCTNLQTAKIDAKFIRGSAFSGCSNLMEISFGADLDTIEMGAFSGCTSLKNLTIDSARFIDEWAFGICTSLQTVSINAQYIDDAFRRCESLQTMILGKDVQSWYFNRDDNYFTTVEINAKSIEKGAFARFSSLRTVIIGENVQSIGEAAFSDCPGLQTVYFKGTSEQWNDIEINNELSDVHQSGNLCLTQAERYYFSEQPNYDGQHWHWDEATHTPEVWTNKD